MAQRNLPTGSVRDPRGSTDGSAHSRGPATGARERNDRERIDALEREVDALQEELARRDGRLQRVVDRYETVLANQRSHYERRIDETSTSSSTATPRGRLFGFLDRIW